MHTDLIILFYLIINYNNNFTENDTKLTDLNTEGIPNVDYTKDPKVHANLERDEKRKKTITITNEGKVFLLIIIILFLSTFVIPYIFDFLREL